MKNTEKFRPFRGIRAIRGHFYLAETFRKNKKAHCYHGEYAQMFSMVVSVANSRQ